MFKKYSPFSSFLIGCLLAAVVTGILVILNSVSTVAGAETPRIIVLMGGTMPSGIIQFLTYVAFFWALMEVFYANQRMAHERHTLTLGLLPEKEHYVMSNDEVMQLRLKVAEHFRVAPNLLTGLIYRAATKYRANQSIPEVMDLVALQVKRNLGRAESRQAIQRYLIWAIPSIGFIGTVIGIANSLGLAGSAMEEGGLDQITAALNVAFDTTLVALVLSLIVMYFYHTQQKREEEMHADLEEYVLEHFVNRLHPD